MMGRYIIDRFRDRAILSGGIPWFRSEDAIQILEEARTAGVPLLGFDATTLSSDNRIQPSLADSWDYTLPRNASMPDKFGHAIKFIEARAASGLCFEIVLGTQAGNSN